MDGYGRFLLRFLIDNCAFRYSRCYLVTCQVSYGWLRPRFLSNDPDGITRANSIRR